MSFERRVEFFLFSVALLAFGWFNQGGGWNQNSRFAEVRAIVDGGELSIDNYFSYQRRGEKMLRRYPVINGDVTIGTKTSRLCWVGDDGNMTAVNGVEPPVDMDGVAIDDLACSGDVSFAKGHFHPNKPPGLSFVALPAYFIISHFERLMHRSPDSWWLMNVNAWLTSVFSVGLISAAGIVLAFRIALMLSAGRLWPSFWTAIAFGFGTLFFPFATLLFDHNVTAVFLVAAFYILFKREGGAWIVLAGFLAGMAAITNYIAAVPTGMLGVYLVVTRWRAGGLPQVLHSTAEPQPKFEIRNSKFEKSEYGWIGNFPKMKEFRVLRGVAYYGLGLLGPLLGICAYNKVCYGSPFALSNAFQNPGFIEKGPVLFGMFNLPNPGVGLILLFSPFRGIFYGAPILAMGVYGLRRMRRTFSAEMWLFIGIALTFFTVNCAFFGWHAGFSCGPRYLIPATAFLALPCVYGFMNMPRISGALLTISIAINFLFTVTDAECPAGVGSLAMVDGREMFLYSPLTEYAIPLFFEGRAWPILNMLIAERLSDFHGQMSANGVRRSEQKPILAKFETDMRQAVAEGSDDPLELGSYAGPVSVNPTGVCEGGYYSLFSPGSRQARWNSFNAGEFWFPESRWSVVPLLALVGLLGGALAWDAGRAGERRRALPFAGALAPEEIVAD